MLTVEYTHKSKTKVDQYICLFKTWAPKKGLYCSSQYYHANVQIPQRPHEYSQVKKKSILSLSSSRE